MTFQKIADLKKKHERRVPVVFFALGFLFDAVTLQRIDEPIVIIQQGLYLLVSAALIAVELSEAAKNIRFQPRQPFLAKLWDYREALLHFLLGTLLNSYTIFYFKSASAFTSFFFIALLVALLMINEFKRFGESQAKVHVAFLSLCLVSYLVSLAPIAMGFIGWLPFFAANAAATLCFYGYYALLKARLSASSAFLRGHLALPFAAVQIAFVLLYFARLIPPVPLSIKYMGIYHDIEKLPGKYRVTYTRPKWRFWQHGDQLFRARPGDSIFCFARIFSPNRFKDELQVRWLFRDPRRGWISSDAIPMPVAGGREEGYRAITKKSNYQPGLWRVQIETRDDREIGRIDFTVELDGSGEAAELKTALL